MNKLAKSIAFIVLGLAALSVFGWMSIGISTKGKDFGFLNPVVEFMYSYPDLFAESVEEIKTLSLPKTFVKTPKRFGAINLLEEDLNVLVSYSDTNNSRSVAIVNLRNDSTLYKWTFGGPILDHERIFHPLLLPQKHLVYSYKGMSLTRVDSLSNTIWTQDSVWPHHAKELDSEGNIWVSTYPPNHEATGKFNINGQPIYFKDEYITKLDGETGRILFHKSITEILVENNMSNYLMKSGNMGDPIHTNDVQPALRTTAFYNKDDVFISAKQLSLILHYRPSSNELINVIEGPFLSQHDVDFLEDGSLVFFNNNYYIAPMNNSLPEPQEPDELTYAGNLYSSIVRYDFETDEFSFIADSILKTNQIFSLTEGLIDFYEPNTCFIEQQNSGLLWIIKENKVIYKNVLKSQHEGYHHLPNWTRILKDNDRK